VKDVVSRVTILEKRITTKTRDSLGDKVKGSLTEVKMSRRSKRSDLDQEKKTHHRGARITVLGVVPVKMVK
jgi:hypothetical protein